MATECCYCADGTPTSCAECGREYLMVPADPRLPNGWTLCAAGGRRVTPSIDATQAAIRKGEELGAHRFALYFDEVVQMLQAAYEVDMGLCAGCPVRQQEPSEKAINAAQRRYDELVAEYLDGGDDVPDPMTAALRAAYAVDFRRSPDGGQR
jgi:hypothetical protein